MYVYIGSPEQRQTLLPDTGSALTVFSCNKCVSCKGGKRFSLFDRLRSFTNKAVLCVYVDLYRRIILRFVMKSVRGGRRPRRVSLGLRMGI